MITDPTLLGRAVAAGLATDEELEAYLRPPDPDPLANLTLEQRVDHAIRHAGSGIWSTCPSPVATVNGRPVPAPPAHRIRGGGPRGRSPRGRGAEPTSTDEPAPTTDH